MMPEITEDKIKAIGKVLCDQNRPLKERFRALFTLRNLGGSSAINCIHECFSDPSALLKHELAYCLGQMRETAAIPALEKVLRDLSQEPMVRHEAAEALGAIGNESVKSILEEYSTDPVIEVAETCQLALGRLKWLKEADVEKQTESPYASIDPAPPSEETSIKNLKQILMDESKPLFERYRAMFALRNLNNLESVLALAEGLKASSALFRHEVAFVLGQLQHDASVPFLKACLENQYENEMVRHECAEALGAIASQECFDILKPYLTDNKRVVKESCEIALDMCEYENSPEFQYANTLLKV